jgi:hypothetical protein
MSRMKVLIRVIWGGGLWAVGLTAGIPLWGPSHPAAVGIEAANAFERSSTRAPDD